MAVNSLASTAAKVLERSNMLTTILDKRTYLGAVQVTAAANESKRTTSTRDAERKAKIRRERAELVKHLYSIMDTNRQTNHTDSSISSDIELPSDSDEWPYCHDYDLEFQRRKTGICRRTKRERSTPAKEQKFKDFCLECQTPENITLERGRKKAIRVKFYKCKKQISRDSNCREQNLDRKANTEKKLRKLGLKRLQECITTRNLNFYQENPAANPFALRAENTPYEMQGMVDFLLNLQGREITPEDYEFLLRLDEFVPTKTVSDKRLASLKEDTASVEDEHEICGICMENYEVGQTKKTLPCEHAFHSSCIDTWLGLSSTKCPLDGREI